MNNCPISYSSHSGLTGSIVISENGKRNPFYVVAVLNASYNTNFFATIAVETKELMIQGCINCTVSLNGVTLLRESHCNSLKRNFYNCPITVTLNGWNIYILPIIIWTIILMIYFKLNSSISHARRTFSRSLDTNM